MEQLIGEKEEEEREAAEIRRQMEEDADEEIEELKNGCERRGTPTLSCWLSNFASDAWIIYT